MHGFVASSACVSPSHIALFIAHLHHKQCSPKSISTYLSAVAFVHKLKNDCDPTQSFLVRKLVAGCYRVNPSVDMRLPVTVEVLDKIINSLSHVSSTVFEAVLFRAMFLFAFNAFARVGELAMTNTSTNLIQFENLSFASEVDQQCMLFFQTLNTTCKGSAMLSPLAMGHLLIQLSKLWKTIFNTEVTVKVPYF